MKCVKCSAPLAADSVFCSRCGAPQRKNAAPADPEETLWMGRFSASAAAGQWMLWGLWVTILIALRLVAPELPGLKVWWVMALSILLPGLVLYVSVIYRKIATRYRLSNYRLFRDTGILIRRHSELELIRVDDVGVTQSLLGKLFNYGDVTLMTSDASDPRIEIAGIADPIQVKEQIRAQVRRRREGAINLEAI